MSNDAAAIERAEIAKFIAWFGRQLNLRGGGRSITSHDLSIMVARGDRAPPGVEEVSAQWSVDPGAEVIALRAQLKIAVGHLEHMAKFLGNLKSGYSFESLSEDVPAMRAMLEERS